MNSKNCTLLTTRNSQISQHIDTERVSYTYWDPEDSIDVLGTINNLAPILLDINLWNKVQNSKNIINGSPLFIFTTEEIDEAKEKQILQTSNISGIINLGKDKELNNIKINNLSKVIPQKSPAQLDSFKLECLANSLSDLVFYKNADSVYIDCNEAFCVSTNKPKSEIVGKTDFDIFHKDTAIEFRENDQFIISNKRTDQSEDWIKYPNGEESLLETIKIPYFDDAGEIIGILGISKDITERKKAQKALRKTEEQYALLAENMADVIWTFDQSNETFNYFSPSIKQLTGYTKEEAINMKLKELIDSKSLPVLEQLLQNTATNREPNNHSRAEIIYKQKDGTEIWTECIVNILPKKDKNKSNTIIGVTRDISKRKETQEKLREKELQLKEAQQLAEIASLEYDLESNDLRFSENFFDVIGIIDYDLQNNFNLKGFFDYIHPEDKKEFIKNIRAIFTKLENLEYTYRVIDSNEVTRNISSFTKFRFNENLDPVTFISTFQNVTNQKVNEKLKRNVELAQKAADMREQFMANISHEIRTPMTGIMGMIDFLIDTDLNQKQRDFAETIKNSSESLLHIINDILLVSKIDAGKLELKENTFNITKTINDVKNLFKPILIQKNLNYKIEIIGDIPYWIVADENRIKQILTNLISNAIKFTDHGSVTIKLTNLNEVEDYLKLKIEIIDTGIGISKKNQSKLFTKFSQVDPSLSRNQEGLGLGLTISKELVELMRGKIGVESELDVGSNFWFTFDAKKSDKKAAPQIAHKSSANNKILKDKKILFAEDKFVNQKVVTLMLENYGCKVTTANNGQEALEMFSTESFDLILMDIQMPVMDGITATQTLNKTYRKLPPIIAISANAMEGDAERYISLGMDDYISKPVKEKTLIAKVSKWLKSEENKSSTKSAATMENSTDYNMFPLLNEDTLKTINEQSGGDMDFLKMLFESFMEDSDQLINEIEKASSTNNHKLMKEAVHSLKGLAGTIGASRLHEITKEMDKNLKDENLEQAIKFVAPVQSFYQEFKDYITKNYLNK